MSSPQRNLSYHFVSGLSTTFFKSFWLFWFLPEPNGEGGIWTLAPLLTTCTLSRGVPSASWVLLQTAWPFSHYSVVKSRFPDQSGEDGIRTHAPVKTNGFQDRPVMTASVPLHYFCALLSARFILSPFPHKVNSFLKIFLIFQ